MPRNEVIAEDFVYEKVAYLSYISGNTNADDRKKMLNVLNKAISAELTDQQRYCLLEHYIHGRRMKDIAKELSLHPSTVTRHIRRAKEKLRHIASYY